MKGIVVCPLLAPDLRIVTGSKITECERCGRRVWLGPSAVTVSETLEVVCPECSARDT